jgi:hypothetical protein
LLTEGYHLRRKRKRLSKTFTTKNQKKRKRLMRIAWNKDKTGVHSEEGRRRIGEASSLRLKGKKKDSTHKKKIAASMRKIKQCSNCPIRSQWIYQVSIPSITHYRLMLCDDCLLGYYKSGEGLEIVT